jgi:hypothetical protein
VVKGGYGTLEQPRLVVIGIKSLIGGKMSFLKEFTIVQHIIHLRALRRARCCYLAPASDSFCDCKYGGDLSERPLRLEDDMDKETHKRLAYYIYMVLCLSIGAIGLLTGLIAIFK